MSDIRRHDARYFKTEMFSNEFGLDCRPQDHIITAIFVIGPANCIESIDDGTVSKYQRLSRYNANRLSQTILAQHFVQINIYLLALLSACMSSFFLIWISKLFECTERNAALEEKIELSPSQRTHKCFGKDWANGWRGTLEPPLAFIRINLRFEYIFLFCTVRCYSAPIYILNW